MLFTYEEMYHKLKNKEVLCDKREEIVQSAFEIGVEPTATLYKTSRNTIKRWRSRYLEKGREGLYDKSKRPHTSPKRTSREVVDKIDSLTKEKKEKKCRITSTLIYKKLDLENEISYGTCNRYVNIALGKKQKRKKSKANGGDTSWKKKLKPFELVQIDVKYLTDISSLKPYFKDNCLAKYEFTFRDVCTGFSICAYGAEKSVYNSTLFIKKILHSFLISIPNLDLKTITVQTDNGSENTNRKRKGPYTGMNKVSTFTEFITDNYKQHRLIIPGHCTAQSDVESFHWTIERECLAWDDIVDNKTLCEYVDKYLNEYNNRKRWKRDFSPVEKIEEYFNCKIEVPKVVILEDLYENVNFS